MTEQHSHSIQDVDLSTVDVDPTKFVLGDWIAGAARVTRSVDVCGKPQLMGEIEELKAHLERPEAETADERPLAKDPRLAAAQRLEALRQEMLASVVTWRFKGLTDDEVKRIRDEVGEDAVGESAKGTVTEFDYRVWAAQVVSVAGTTVKVEWPQMRDLHEALGQYFLQTIARTANSALRAEGVDVPFSLRSSALIAQSSTT